MPSASNADGIHELPRYLTVKEAAEYLRVNVKTVYAAIASRVLRAVKFGRILRIPREALIALADGAAPPNPSSSRRGRRDR